MAFSAWKDVQTAINSTLTGDSTLMSKISEVTSDVPDDRTFPFITIGEGTETRFNTFSKDGRELSIDLQIWSNKDSFLTMYEILDDVVRLLDDNTLSITNYLTVIFQYDSSRPIDVVVDEIKQIDITFQVIVQNS